MPAKRIQPAKKPAPAPAPATRRTAASAPARKKSPYSGLTPPWPYDHHDLHVQLAREAYKRKHGVSAPVTRAAPKVTKKPASVTKNAPKVTKTPKKSSQKPAKVAAVRRAAPRVDPLDKPPYTTIRPAGTHESANAVTRHHSASIQHSAEWYAKMIARDQAAIRKQRTATTAAQARAARKAADANPAALEAPLARNPDMEYARLVAEYKQAAADLKHWGNLNATDKGASEHQREVYLHHIRDARERMALAHRELGIRRGKLEAKKRRRPARRR